MKGNKSFWCIAAVVAVLVLLAAVAPAGFGQTVIGPTNLSNTAQMYELIEHRGQNMAIDKSGTIYVVWYQSPGRVFFSRSTDKGGPFSAPLSLAPLQDEPFIALDESGVIYIAAAGYGANGKRCKYVTSSRDGGLTFTTPVDISRMPAIPHGVSLAIGPDGSVNAVFPGASASYSDVYFTRSVDGARTFSLPIQLSTSAENVHSPRVLVDEAGRIFVWWYEYPGKVFFARSVDNGGSFSPQLQIGQGTDGELAVDPAGYLYFVWRGSGFEWDQSSWSIAKSTDWGATFVRKDVFGDSCKPAGYPQISVGPSGNVYILGTDGRGAYAEACFTRSTDHGETIPRAVNLSGTPYATDLNPRLAISVAEKIAVVWIADVAPGSGVYEVLFRSSTDLGLTFAPILNISNTPQTRSQRRPQIAFDSAGNLNVIWEDNPDPYYEVYFGRVEFNRPPAANAGPDQTAECTGAGGCTVMLDGSGSSDPDEDTLTYEWKDVGGNVVGTEATVNLTVPRGTYTFTLTVNDGKGGTASDTVQVTVHDTTAPNLTLVNDSVTVVLPTATATGAVVDVLAASGAAATDICDPEVQLTRSGPVEFPIGATTVTITATDDAGNYAQKTFTVRVVYDFGGFLAPILNDGSSIFKSGRTIPIKFQLTAADGSFVTNASASLAVYKLSNEVWGTVEVDSAGESNDENSFRFDPATNQYIFNLKTTGYGAGTYKLVVTLSDGTTHEVLVSVK